MAPAHSGAVSAHELHALLHRDELPLPAQPAAQLGPHFDPFSMGVLHRCARTGGTDSAHRATPSLSALPARPARCARVRRLFAELGCDPEADRLPHATVAAHPLGARLLGRCGLYRRSDIYELLQAKLEAAGDALDM